jgi:hypothetical protein
MYMNLWSGLMWKDVGERWGVELCGVEAGDLAALNGVVFVYWRA